MSGVTGFKEQIRELRTSSDFAAKVLHQAFILEVVSFLVEKTWHSSSNAAYNWRVSDGSGTPSYVDFKGIEPVGIGYDLRSDSGNIGAIKAVAAASVSRENANVVDNLYNLETVKFSNAIDFVSKKYVERAELAGAVSAASSHTEGASNIAKFATAIKYEKKHTGWFL